MSKRMTNDERMEARDRARAKADDRAYDRIEGKCRAAEELIGVMIQEGQPVHYINLVNKNGVPTGKIKIGSHINLVDYLIRNRYV
jgi:hypothetical protein